MRRPKVKYYATFIIASAVACNRPVVRWRSVDASDVLTDELIIVDEQMVDGGLSDELPDVPIENRPVQLVVGQDFTCSLWSDGTVRCWGQNSVGQLGDGTTNNSVSPRTVMGISSAVELSAGASNVCARLSDRTVWCWGYNADGQLGNQRTANAEVVPVNVQGLRGAIDIDFSGFHGCAIIQNRTVQCWGLNEAGQLGDGTNITSFSPVQVGNLNDAEEIVVGDSFSCARRFDGTAVCWGLNQSGQLGNGMTSATNTPVGVRGLAGVLTVSAGNRHACARLPSGFAQCWGENSSGQLGDGTGVASNTPTNVSVVSDFVGVVAGNFFSCGWRTNGLAVCWGYNNTGQLGNSTGGNETSLVPIQVRSLEGISRISTGHRQSHSCALLNDNTVWCWGANSFGQLGNGTASFSELTPVQVRW